MNKTSAYELIKENIGEDGKLPHAFFLGKALAPNEVGFMPGVVDGVCLFYPGKKDHEKLVEKLLFLLTGYFKTENAGYLTEIEKAIAGFRVISFIDELLQNLRHAHEDIDPKQMFWLSLQLVKNNENPEIVKIGLSILGFFNLSRYDDIVQIVSTLALYEDFTFYAISAASNWSNGNDLIFQMAKKVDGWGKVHAVNILEPTTEEIREWILRKGCANKANDCLLGFTCAMKGDMISALRQNSIEREMFDSLAVIIHALLDEDQLPGISVYDHDEEALLRYLHHAKNHAQDLKHFCNMLSLRDWVESSDIDYKDELLEQCLEIINRPDWPEKVIATIANDDHELSFVSTAANAMNMDVSAGLFTLINADPLKHYELIPNVMQNSEMAARIIELYESILPLDQMAEGMGDYLFHDKFCQEYDCLDYILFELAEYPLKGIKFIKAGLNSRVIRSRNQVCRVLLEWSKSLNKPLSHISQELYDEITRISSMEVNEHTKESMLKLLDE